MKPHTLDALAALRVQAGRGQPFRDRLDGCGVAIELPAPNVTARALDLFSGATLLRKDSTVVLPDGSPPTWTLRDVAERLVDSWAALPDREDAGRPYRDLRLVSEVARDVATEYATAVLRAWVDTLEPAPKPERRRRSEKTPDAERKRSSRERLREDEQTSSRWWLDGLLEGRWTADAEGDWRRPAPGTRLTASKAHRAASREISDAVEEREEIVSVTPPPEPEAGESLDDFADRLRAHERREAGRLTHADRLQDWQEVAEENLLPERPRVPTRTVFYSVADETLGPRRAIKGRSVYTIPETRGGIMPNPNPKTRDAFAEEILDRIARLAWEERGADLETYLSGLVEDRDRREEQTRDAGGRFTAATGTDGAVVDLDSRRRT